jgi:hypothetical protein
VRHSLAEFKRIGFRRDRREAVFLFPAQQHASTLPRKASRKPAQRRIKEEPLAAGALSARRMGAVASGHFSCRAASDINRWYRFKSQHLPQDFLIRISQNHDSVTIGVCDDVVDRQIGKLFRDFEKP